MDSYDIVALYDEAEPFENKNGKNDRFSYAKVRKGPRWYFIKTARDKSFRINIQREVVWCEFMHRVAVFSPNSHLFGPRIERRIGEMGLVFDYIDAPLVATVDEVGKWQANLTRYAAMLETFDAISLNWKSDYLPDAPSRSFDVYGTWQGWLGENIQRIPYIEEARNSVESVSLTLTRCMQHGDLTPWQIFERGEDWIIYDGEKSGTDLFRFTDLAYGFGRLYTLLGAKSTAQELLRQFMSLHEGSRGEFLDQFLPVMTHISVAMMADAFNDEVEHDYIASAAELLEACLDKRLDILGIQ